MTGAAVFLLFTVPLAVTRDVAFADPANLETSLRQTTIVAVAPLGMTAVIIAGGIDLWSVPSSRWWPSLSRRC